MPTTVHRWMGPCGERCEDRRIRSSTSSCGSPLPYDAVGAGCRPACCSCTKTRRRRQLSDARAMSTLPSSSLHPSVPSSSSSSSASSHYASTRYRIALVSDFFHPRLGGVELHQYSVAQALLQRGHTVIVITGTYAAAAAAADTAGQAQRQGVRYLTNGLKVYYCPHLSFHQQASLHTLYAFLPLLRCILVRERIQLLHAHQATSMLAHEAILHAATAGLPCIYTDHSLFGFSSLSSIHLNKLLTFTLSLCSAAIAVSHCSKDNLCLRAQLDPHIVHVIPNAVDTSQFTPQPQHSPTTSTSTSPHRVKVLVLSRLVYRKGLDLAIDVIPLVCAQLPYVDFVIGGDGPKRIKLDEMRERCRLHDRIALLGPLPHSAIPAALSAADLFLNCSLTEAFCIAILEAVSCGLPVVSTRVGGVPEILPPELLDTVDVDVHAIVAAVVRAVERVQHDRQHGEHYMQQLRWQRHEAVRSMYNWHVVAESTERVYDSVMAAPKRGLAERLECVQQAGGAVAGMLWCWTVLLDALLLWMLEWWRPREGMEESVDFPRDEYEARLEKEWRVAQMQPVPNQTDSEDAS